MVIRTFGRQGLIERIREHLRLGQALAQWVDADPDFERLAPAPLSTVCLRFRPRDLQHDEAYLNQLNTTLIEAINAEGNYYLSGTHLNGRFTIRVAISGLRTDEAAVRGVWQQLQETAARLDEQLRGVG
jgi:aromatic-L-amino-acid decarboxylase